MEQNLMIGLLKEISPDEERVALTPYGASNLVSKGYKLYIERGAGQRFFSDEAYEEAGAILTIKAQVIEKANFFPKIKQLSGEGIEHQYNKENKIKSFAHIVNQYLEKSAKFILSFFFVEHLTKNVKELYKKANIKLINHDSNVLSVMSQIYWSRDGERWIRKI